MPEVIDTNGTCLQGFVTVSYDRLVKTFGEPTNIYEETDRKRNFRWVIEVDGLVATIYDCYEFTSHVGLKARPRVRWHIGGKDHRVVPLICNRLKAIGQVFP